MMKAADFLSKKFIINLLTWTVGWWLIFLLLEGVLSNLAYYKDIDAMTSFIHGGNEEHIKNYLMNLDPGMAQRLNAVIFWEKIGAFAGLFIATLLLIFLTIRKKIPAIVALIAFLTGYLLNGKIIITYVGISHYLPYFDWRIALAIDDLIRLAISIIIFRVEYKYVSPSLNV